MPCFDCESAQAKGYAYWCSICSTFIPSKILTPIEDTEEVTEELICNEFQCGCNDTKDRAGIILTNTKGELLLVRGPTGKLSLPKGKRKVCETEYEGACRECLEESGIDVRGMPIKRKETIQDVVYFYVTYTGSLEATLGSVNSSEISQVKWWKILKEDVKDIPFKRIPENILDPELLQEYTGKLCNISLDTLLQKKKFYQAILKHNQLLL
jgi:8-oxo-dGTP pyrophosphatase MutT (NUDIX family)